MKIYFDCEEFEKSTPIDIAKALIDTDLPLRDLLEIACYLVIYVNYNKEG